MIPRNTLSPDEYRVPLTPDGTVEFVPDASGVEQIDLRLSRLEHLTGKAIGLAEASQPASPERADNRRGEYGERVVELASHAQPEQIQNITDPKVLLNHTARIYNFRKIAIDESNRAA
ncbi:hypothetical protein H7Y29_01745 [Microbacteriaceae bacterium]|nr:hypothetical protein [Candidatus Saccharibacteria bacterium]